MSVRISLDGQVIDAEPGDTVAAALLRARITTFTRSIKYHRPRGPFCFAGTCGQCLMRVDGVPSQPACRTPVQEGMSCERQNAPLGLVDQDVFRAADFVFSQGLDHHHLMVQSRVLGRVALEVARRLAGLGTLPDQVRQPVPGTLRRVQLAVIGAGPSGLAAARAAAEAGAQVLLLERDARVGGSALLRLDAAAPEIEPQALALLAAKGELLTGALCIGLYPNDTSVPGAALLAVRQGEALCAVVAEKVVVACGGAPQPVPFPGVDRPGVYAARGLVALQQQCGVRVGEKLALLGDGPELFRCASALERAGYGLAVIATPGAEGPPGARTGAMFERALGNPVKAVEIAGERIRCDAVALAFPPAPLHELATSAGAQARWDARIGGFPVQADADGRTSVPWIFAAGSMAGGVDGARAGKAAAL